MYKSEEPSQICNMSIASDSGSDLTYLKITQ